MSRYTGKCEAMEKQITEELKRTDNMLHCAKSNQKCKKCNKQVDSIVKPVDWCLDCMKKDLKDNPPFCIENYIKK